MRANMNLNGKITNPGELRTRINLGEKAISTETGGFQVPDWDDTVEVWARWVNVHGAEVWQSKSVQAVSPATVLIRYYAGLDTTWSVVKDGVRYEIISVDDIGERHEYMELKVQRMKAG